MLRHLLLRVAESYFRHPFLNLTPLFMFTMLGIAYLILQPETYIANSNLAVNSGTITEASLGLRPDGSPWKTPAEFTVSEIDELLESDSMIRSIIYQTDIESTLLEPETDIDLVFEIIRNDIWAIPIGESHFAVFAKSESPEIAVQLVEATTATFLNWNKAVELADAEASVELFSSTFDDSQAEFEAAQAALTQFLIDNPKPVRSLRTEVERIELEKLTKFADQAAARVASSRGRLDYSLLVYKLAEAEAGEKFQILDVPVLPDEPARSISQVVGTLLRFTLLGAIISGLLVLVNAGRDRTVKYPIDVQYLFGQVCTWIDTD